MTSPSLACCALALTAVGLHASPADDALAAATKLSTAASYSWTTRIDQGGHTADIRGQTGGGAYSLLTFTGFSSAASPGGNGTNAVFLGDDKYVIETSQGWVAPANTPAASDDTTATNRANNNTSRGGTRGGSGGGMRGRGGAGGRGGGSATRNRSGGSGNNQDSSVATRPRLPTAINLPHEELSLLATNSTDLQLDAGVLSGKLTQSGADLVFAPPGSTQRAPKGAAGTFRLWIQDGNVTKYELKLTADAAPGGGRSSNGFTETVTVELSKVDNTQFTIPSAAKTKLGY